MCVYEMIKFQDNQDYLNNRKYEIFQKYNIQSILYNYVFLNSHFQNKEDLIFRVLKSISY